MQKSTFLKVMGILMIIIASLSMLSSVLCLAGAGIFAAVDTAYPNWMDNIVDNIIDELPEYNEFSDIPMPDIRLAVQELIWVGIAGLTASVCQLIAGISALKNHTRPDKVTLCIVLSALTLAISVFSRFAFQISGSGLLTGAAVPLLTIIAAAIFKMSAPVNSTH